VRLPDVELPDCLERWPDETIHIAGHRVMLYHVYDGIDDGVDLEWLCNRFPTIDPDQIQVVMDFCKANEDLVRRHFFAWARGLS
jgi:uncharacterized protein (DUF433 family)